MSQNTFYQLEALQPITEMLNTGLTTEAMINTKFVKSLNQFFGRLIKLHYVNQVNFSDKASLQFSIKHDVDKGIMISAVQPKQIAQHLHRCLSKVYELKMHADMVNDELIEIQIAQILPSTLKPSVRKQSNWWYQRFRHLQIDPMHSIAP